MLIALLFRVWVSYIVERKANYFKLKLKLTIVTSSLFTVSLLRANNITSSKYILCNKNASVPVYYNTNVSNSFKNCETIARDSQHTLLIPIINKVNGKTKNLKNKNFIFISICNIHSLKLAYYQLRSNLRILLFNNSKIALNNVNEKWFIRTSKLCEVKILSVVEVNGYLIKMQ